MISVLSYVHERSSGTGDGLEGLPTVARAIAALAAGSGDRPLRRQFHFVVDAGEGAEAVARGVTRWIEARGGEVQVVRLPMALRPTALFRRSLRELVYWCEASLPPMRRAGTAVHFNLFGSAASGVAAFLMQLAPHYADELWVDGPSGEAMRLPQFAPPSDPAALSNGRLDALRRLAIGLPVSARAAAALEPSLKITLAPEAPAELSEWGALLWCRCRRHAYDRRLLEPPDSRVTFAPKLLRQSAELAPDRLVMLNDLVDRLCARVAGVDHPDIWSAPCWSLPASGDLPATLPLDPVGAMGVAVRRGGGSSTELLELRSLL